MRYTPSILALLRTVNCKIPLARLLARVLKEGVRFWYNNTFTVKRGGGGVPENVPLENL
jgi:hypothetical protein